MKLLTRNSKLTTPLLDSLIQSILIIAIALTPLLFSLKFSELFEFPKMVLIYALALTGLFILATKWVIQQRIDLIKTPLTWPLLAFLAWLIITTIFSLHPYTSIAGYYTRFNGGLASYAAYAALFYLLLDQLVLENRKSKIENRNNSENKNQNASSLFSIFYFLFSRLSKTSTVQKLIHRREVRTQATPQQQRCEECPSTDAPRPQTVPHAPHSCPPRQGRNSLLTTHLAAKLLTAWLISATIVSIWAILEHFGHDPSCLVINGTFGTNCWVQDVQARVFSTFGQPNWLATYLVATIPIGIIAIFTSQSNPSRWLAALATIIYYAAFWYTYSRSGWFGLIAALIVLLLCVSWQTIWQHRLQLTALLIGCLIVSFASFNSAALRAETSLSGRGDDSSTGSIRLMVWQGALQDILDHPILGTGLGTFAYSFLPYRPVEMNNTTEWNFLYNLAHNQVLNTAADVGIPGLLLWLSLFAITAIYIWPHSNLFSWIKNEPKKSKPRTKSQRKSRNLFSVLFSHLFRISHFSFQDVSQGRQAARQPGSQDTISNFQLLTTHLIPAALAAGITGVFVSQLFGFAVVMTNLLLFLSVALIFAPTAKIYSLKLINRQKYAFAILALFTLIPSTFLLLRYVSAELLIVQANRQLSVNPIAATQTYQKAISQNPWEPNYRIKYAGGLINATPYASAKTNNFQAADHQLQAALSLNPHDLIIAKSATFYYRTMATQQSDYQTQALQTAQAATQLAATDADARQTLADLQVLYDQPQALSSLDTLINLRPNAAESYLHRTKYWQKVNNQEALQKDLATALQLDPNNQEAKQMMKEHL